MKIFFLICFAHFCLLPEFKFVLSDRCYIINMHYGRSQSWFNGIREELNHQAFNISFNLLTHFFPNTMEPALQQ